MAMELTTMSWPVEATHLSKAGVMAVFHGVDPTTDHVYIGTLEN